MNWKIKARIQNIIALLPDPVSYEAYYWIQRRFGGLKKITPYKDLSAGLEICRQIEGVKRSWIGKIFLEIGTGRRINIPLALWLMGASRIITVDLNPYLKEELVKEDVIYIIKNKEKIKELFGDYILQDRLSDLVNSFSITWQLKEIIEFCNIYYISPGDASRLSLLDKSVDFHVSRNVFEHIPKNTLHLIIQEAGRLLSDEGLLVHRIDFSDHFSHSDDTLSSINFLQFSDKEWDQLAGNRYMYMNRLRLDDIEDVFEKAGQYILKVDSIKDYQVADMLINEKIILNERFISKSIDVLSTSASWVISENKAG